MTVENPPIDQKFLQRQRESLIALRDRLKVTRDGQSEELRQVNETSGLEAHEFEDDAQKLTLLEVAGSVGAVSQARLRDVERALQKLDEGTYGVSEKSGLPISIERLVAVPEAIYTVAEQAEDDAIT